MICFYKKKEKNEKKISHNCEIWTGSLEAKARGFQKERWLGVQMKELEFIKKYEFVEKS